MSENNDPSPEVPASPTASETPAPETAAKRTLRDRFAGMGTRLNGTRGLIAATLAALIVGGFGGAAIQAAVGDDDHDHGRFRDSGGRMGPGERPGDRGDFFQQGPPGFQGPLPPTTTPEDDDSSPTPSPGDSPSS